MRRWPALGLCALTALVVSACSLLQGQSVVVTWTVESEQGTAGYNLFRAESADGPFVQINKSLIPAQGDPVVGHTYTYTDDAVECGKTYWYKLQEVETSGTLTMIEDKVTQVTACR